MITLTDKYKTRVFDRVMEGRDTGLRERICGVTIPVRECDSGHQRVIQNLNTVFTPYATSHGYMLYPNNKFCFKIDDDNILRPDFTLISGLNAPLLIIEVLSMFSDYMDTVIKPVIYSKAGVLEYWRINTLSCAVDIMVNEGWNGVRKEGAESSFKYFASTSYATVEELNSMSKEDRECVPQIFSPISYTDLKIDISKLFDGLY